MSHCCGSCKFWNQDTTWGDCLHPRMKFNVFCNSILQESIVTSIDFGCILYEKKESDIGVNELLQKMLDSKKAYQDNLKINLQNLEDEIKLIEEKLGN